MTVLFDPPAVLDPLPAAAPQPPAEPAPTPPPAPPATMTERTAELRELRERVRRGPSEKATEAQHAKGKLTARERIDLLLDE
ncbi:hypothetical protein ACIQBJ_24855, partial [Kitasatospora sp. NPDC088391]